jgi:hypothetical protein
VARGKKGGGGNEPQKLTAGRQQQRLAQQLKVLKETFDAHLSRLRTSPDGVIPEDVLVLETAGTVDEFIKAVRNVQGLEFLAEYDESDIAPDADFYVDKKGVHVAYTGRVYLVCASRSGYDELLKLWRLWQTNGEFKRGFTKWRDVFSLLRDIRPWGLKDRLLETGVTADWQDRLAREEVAIPCELELWFRDSKDRRLASATRVRSEITRLGGTVLSEAEVASIRYHAIGATVPTHAVREFVQSGAGDLIALVQCEDIQFVRAAGQMVATPRGESATRVLDLSSAPTPTGDPVIALLDGLPLQNHLALRERLIVDDPDDFGKDYRSDARSHGTAMASLIIWGDLNSTTKPTPQPVYVRPIMRPVDVDGVAIEQIPNGVLAVDLLHRAVLRLFEASSGKPAAPSVSTINLSIGIRDRSFDGMLSPLARLVDWLSWKYQKLFVISAGNHVKNIELGVPWSTVTDNTLNKLVLSAIANDTRNRRLLSPAESVNALTVGALHSDTDDTKPSASRLDPLPLNYPSPISAHGLGYRRSIKPEILAPGGRTQFEPPFVDSDTSIRCVRAASAPGHEVAAPGPSGAVTYTARSRGTSNAAAMVSRTAALIAPAISELRDVDEFSVLKNVSDALILKALVAHGARWGALALELREHLSEREDVDAYIQRLLGFGPLQVDNIVEGTSKRVTAIAAGRLGVDEAVSHRFPLPPGLSGKRGMRRMTVTLAWFTPVAPLSHRWRQAQLWFEVPESKLVIDRDGPDWQAAQRGTLQHDSYAGEKASAIQDGDDATIRVSCREDAPGLKESIPYALAVTLEVGETIDVDVYEQVSSRIRARAKARAQARG